MANNGLTNDQTMAGVLAVLSAMREDALNRDKNVEARKTEVVLYEAGLTAIQIAGVLGKKTDTVAKTLQRARKAKTDPIKKVDSDDK